MNSQDQNNTEKAHSDIGASSLYRWSKCAGSVRLSKGIPSKSSVYAEEGTIAHELASNILLKKSIDPTSHKYPDMMAAVMEYVNLIREEIETDKSEYDIVLIEHRFHLKQIHPDAFGTADCVIYKHNSRTLKVFDYKHGQGHVVDVKNNPQLYYYALGAMLSLPQIKAKSIESIIVQPRAFHHEGSIRREEYTPIELFNFAGDLTKYIAETEKPNAAISPGEWCHFCNAKAKCPVLHDKAVEAAKQEFSVQKPYDPEKLSKTLELLPAIEAWIKGVREFAYSEAEQGRCPPGHKLVAKRASRQWSDVNKVASHINHSFTRDIAVQCFSEPELKSVAQIEKIMGKKDFVQLQEQVVSISSGTTLVGDDDKRPPVMVGSEFQKVETKNLFA